MQRKKYGEMNDSEKVFILTAMIKGRCQVLSGCTGNKWLDCGNVPPYIPHGSCIYRDKNELRQFGELTSEEQLAAYKAMMRGGLEFLSRVKGWVSYTPSSGLIKDNYTVRIKGELND